MSEQAPHRGTLTLYIDGKVVWRWHGTFDSPFTLEPVRDAFAAVGGRQIHAAITFEPDPGREVTDA